MTEAVRLFGNAKNIADAARKSGYSRTSLHAWRKEGCPAFNKDGTVDLEKLSAWIVETGHGEGHGLEPIEVAVFDTEAGGRDFGIDYSMLTLSLFRFIGAIRLSGHTQAAEEIEALRRKHVLPFDSLVFRVLERHGLTAPDEGDDDR